MLRTSLKRPSLWVRKLLVNFLTPIPSRLANGLILNLKVRRIARYPRAPAYKAVALMARPTVLVKVTLANARYVIKLSLHCVRFIPVIVLTSGLLSIKVRWILPCKLLRIMVLSVTFLNLSLVVIMLIVSIVRNMLKVIRYLLSVRVLRLVPILILSIVLMVTRRRLVMIKLSLCVRLNLFRIRLAVVRS